MRIDFTESPFVLGRPPGRVLLASQGCEIPLYRFGHVSVLADPVAGAYSFEFDAVPVEQGLRLIVAAWETLKDAVLLGSVPSVTISLKRFKGP